MSDYQEIYLAGGCFWGLEKYFANVSGVVRTETGYANGRTEKVTYEAVCRKNTGHAETVRVMYDPQKISLQFLLELYYEAIDPIAVNQQGGDRGSQYRTGIYYSDASAQGVIVASIARLQKKYAENIAIEVMPLQNYTRAEDYHQNYLDQNPSGYCHIRPELMAKAKMAVDPRQIQLDDMAYYVTQNNGTEPPFQNAYYDHFEAGIYVDVTTSEPLFLSTAKYDSGCGWPSFFGPINDQSITEISDHSHGMQRTEVRSKTGNAHLGHVFEDGPEQMGGLRYCINSAALRFVAKAQMVQAGYGAYLSLLDKVQGRVKTTD